ncbi:MAG: methylated-DNA--[protein]-cysteine S-methyltransferase [Simkaniaceae bacterium]|nr:methylated-DNA--[protein]-cysteine S-methyltransferase [Candidatus Sacchlamyda saccharinae]
MSSQIAQLDKTGFWRQHSCLLHFQNTKLQKITLKKADRFGLVFIDSPELPEVVEWFTHLLKGETLPFPLPLHLKVGPFQKQVLEKLQKIPLGETRSYKEIACQLGRPGAARAVGTACRINPYPLVIPCHRVISSGGGLGGFAYGVAMKRRLLDFEDQIGSS